MRILVASLVLVACKKPAPTETDSDPPTDTDAQSTADTASVVGTADTAPPEPPPVVDCTTLPSGPLVYNRLQAPRAYHGLAFDELGHLDGNDNTSMIRATAPNQANIWIPNTGGAQQMDYLPTGELVVASINAGRIIKVLPGGGTEVLASGINAYGVEVGPDGLVYTANQNVVHRIDPVNGGATVYLASIGSPKVLNFSPDGTKMYVGTNNGTGAVYEVALDANTDPVGSPVLLANTGGSWHDGLGIDACGNLYVAEFFTRSLYLITPTGEVSTLVDYNDISGSAYGHGIQWGSGIGPWSDHSIYVPLPYDGNRVAELELGRPSKDYNGGYYEVLR